jgi:hypothetical protein
MIDENNHNKGRPNEGKYTNINRKKWLWDSRKVLSRMTHFEELQLSSF